MLPTLATIPGPAELFAMLLWPVLIPGAVSTAIIGAAWRPWRRGEHAERGPGAGWAVPACVGLAAFVAFVSQESPISMPLGARWHAVGLLAIALIPAGLLASAIHHRMVSVFVSAVAAAGLVWWLVDLPTLDAPRQRLGLGLAAAALVLAAEGLAVRRPGPVVPLAFWMSFTAASMAATSAGFAKLGLIAASVSAVCGAAALVGLVQPRFRVSGGGVAVLAPLLVVLLATGFVYDQRETASLAPWILMVLIVPLTFLADTAAGVFRIGPSATVEDAGSTPPAGIVVARRRLVADGVRLLLPLLAMVAAVLLAGGGSAGDSDEDGADDYSEYGPLGG